MSLEGRKERRVMPDGARSVFLIIVCQVAAMTLWFSTSSGAASLLEAGEITGTQAAMLTGAVQLGFVAGTLVSAWFGLADRFDPRIIFAISAFMGAATNLTLVGTGFGGEASIFLRLLTGGVLAGIYPVGMKLAAAWAGRSVGLMMGTLVGALTLGSALPHMFSALNGLDWRMTVTVSSVCAVFAGGAILLCRLGPQHRASPHFVPGEAWRELRRRSVLLANAGYFGHMWELYAMWAWIGVFLKWAVHQPGFQPGLNPTWLAFFAIASGAVGCIGAGLLADRLGRTTITMVAMIVSGSCAATIGLLASTGVGVLCCVIVIWGIAIVADSAQFSAAVAELSPPRLVGSMLTIQTSIGFLLSLVTIQMMPFLVDLLSWRFAFAILAVGPFFGTLAMWRLRRDPDAAMIAGGRK